MSYNRPKPLVLAILDGWGHAHAGSDNAIETANTPNINMVSRNFPNGLINASELHVGLPSGQMGNSEVGHMNIGSGRVLMQELPKIDATIADGSLAKKTELKNFIAKNKSGSGVTHVMGLFSDGGVHSHMTHMIEIAKIIANDGLRVKLHLFLDGRDTPPQSAINYLETLDKAIAGISNIEIATICGRYYAMDRDNRWERVQKAYDVLTQGMAAKESAISAVKQSYADNVNDEFVIPVAIGNYKGMNDGDGLLMCNFRADRAREILTALLDPKFTGFTRNKQVKFSATLGMVEYSSQLANLIPALFAPEQLTNILGEIIANTGLKQLRIAETEKYAHVTFFFNGGREQEFVGEERILVPSPKVATYDEKPEMSAYEVTEKLVVAIDSEKFDFIVVNYANTDMVGHTGDIQAAVKAVEAVDICLGKVIEATLGKGGAMIITADHGNAEKMFDETTGQPHTAHTLNLVPVIIISDDLRGKKISITDGKLGDIAPTILQLLGLKQPIEMTGRSLLGSYA
ncbi:MAG: 2,3-bisphosphoglycerate-independent phosphoglycerate mutase [Pseudomonadota bacterium]